MPGKKLWSMIDGEPWLDENPRRRRRRKGSKGRKRHRRARAARHRRSRKRMPAGLRRFLEAKENRHMKRRGRRRNSRVHGRHRRSHRRHNPPRFSLKGIGARVVDGAKGGAAVLLGEAVSSAIPKLIPVAAIQTGLLNSVAELLTAIFTAPLVGKMIGGKYAQAYVYGGFARVGRGFVIGANIPILSPALASYPGSLMALPSPTGVTSLAAYDGGFMADEEMAVQ